MPIPESVLTDEQSIRSVVRRLVRELAPNQALTEVTSDLRLVEDLQYHSLALMELAFTLEDEFGLGAINQEQADKIATVEHVEEHVVGELMRNRAAI